MDSQDNLATEITEITEGTGGQVKGYRGQVTSLAGQPAGRGVDGDVGIHKEVAEGHARLWGQGTGYRGQVTEDDDRRQKSEYRRKYPGAPGHRGALKNND